MTTSYNNHLYYIIYPLLRVWAIGGLIKGAKAIIIMHACILFHWMNHYVKISLLAITSKSEHCCHKNFSLILAPLLPHGPKKLSLTIVAKLSGTFTETLLYTYVWIVDQWCHSWTNWAIFLGIQDHKHSRVPSSQRYQAAWYISAELSSIAC